MECYLSVDWELMPVEAQKAAGHSSLDTTVFYTKLMLTFESATRLRRILERLGIAKKEALKEDLKTVNVTRGVH